MWCMARGGNWPPVIIDPMRTTKPTDEQVLDIGDCVADYICAH